MSIEMKRILLSGFVVNLFMLGGAMLAGFLGVRYQLSLWVTFAFGALAVLPMLALLGLISYKFPKP